MPLTVLLFGKFFDKGYIFSKVLGIIIVSYLSFILSTFHIVPFTTNVLFFCMFLLVLVNYLTLYVRKTSLKEFFSLWEVWVFEEAVFLGGIFLWSFVRGTQPQIHGLEKYMDFGFINSILRTTYFPPKDMWYTPYPINYYYFGHLTTAVLTKLSGLSSNITFNLMLATVFSFTLLSTFSLGATFIKDLLGEKITRIKGVFTFLLGGILTAFITTFGGNLHTIYSFFGTYDPENPIPFWQIPFSLHTFPNGYWYPNATRFIYHTIHEFPLYSFVVSDLHGHVLDIPFVLTFIALLFTLFFQHNIQLKKRNLWLGAILGFFTAILYMTNAWDGGIYLLLTLAFIFLSPLRDAFTTTKPIKIFTYEHLTISFYFLVTIFAAFFLISFPFSHFFNAGELVSGIGVLCAPSFLTNLGRLGPFLFEINHCQHSPLWQLAILYGFFFFWIGGFMVFIIQKKRTQLKPVDLFICIISLLATILIVIPEFIYLKDIYPAHYRANTMFKLVYQAFMLLSLAAGYSIIRISERAKNISGAVISGLYKGLGIILFCLIAIYPYFAIPSYYNFKTYSGLDGTAYLSALYPTDYAAIQWLNAHIYGQPVILEAQGDSYTDFARVSSNTGLPTVLGWTVHEWLWRGSYNPLPERIQAVQVLYETPDIHIAKMIVQKYHIQLIFIGDLERRKYVGLSETKFSQLGKIIYQNGTTVIYQIK